MAGTVPSPIRDRTGQHTWVVLLPRDTFLKAQLRRGRRLVESAEPPHGILISFPRPRWRDMLFAVEDLQLVPLAQFLERRRELNRVERGDLAVCSAVHEEQGDVDFFRPPHC